MEFDPHYSLDTLLVIGGMLLAAVSASIGAAIKLTTRICKRLDGFDKRFDERDTALSNLGDKLDAKFGELTEKLASHEKLDLDTRADVRQILGHMLSDREPS